VINTLSGIIVERGQIDMQGDSRVPAWGEKKTTDLPGSSILVVEDDGVIALRIIELLAGAGYIVRDPVASGEDAVAEITRSPPDLIIMDIGLTGMIDGLEAARLIRNEHDIPVIFLTSYADDDRLGRARDISPFGYLIKPFRDDKLLESIEGALIRNYLQDAK